MKINSNNILRFSTIILIVGVILAIISPFVFTRKWGWISFQETGQIGDTIGGITAPIVNLIGAILVYFALSAQIDANKIIQGQIDEQKKFDVESKNFNNLLKIYDEIKNDIEDFTYTVNEVTGSLSQMMTGGIPPNYFTYKGKEATDKAYSKIKRDFCRTRDNEKMAYTKSTSHETFLAFFRIFDTLLSKTSKSPLAPEDKETFIDLLRYLFETKLKPLISKDGICEECSDQHNELPDDLNNLIIKIQTELTQI